MSVLRAGHGGGPGNDTNASVYGMQFAPPSELAKPPLPQARFTSNFTATNQAESHGCQPPFLKINQLSLVTVAILYYQLHSNCIQLEGKYL